MAQAKPAYHHGDLYQTLIKAALAIMQDEGLEALSMRKLAERAGVSAAAPYHHFKDKHALLCQIAEQGFRQQDQLLHQAFRQTQDGLLPVQRVEQFVVDYIRFACDNPAQYTLMYGSAIWKSGNATPALQQVAKNSFRSWLAEIERLQALGVLGKSVPALRQAQVAWSTLHGLCHQVMDGVYLDPAQVDDIARSAIRMLFSNPNQNDRYF